MQNPQPPFQQFPVAPRPNAGRVALRYGFIFGGLIGLIDILYSYYLDAANPIWLSNLLQPFYSLPTILADAVTGFLVSLPLYVIMLVFFILAGFFAARKAQTISAGAIAGLFVAGLYLLIDLLVVNIAMTILLIFPQMAQGTPAADVSGVESSLIISGVVYSLVAGLFLLGIGAAMGALGGTMGRGKHAPAPAYPAYPPYPSDAYQAQQPVYYAPPLNPYAPPAQPGQPLPPGQFPPYPPSSGQ